MESVPRCPYVPGISHSETGRDSPVVFAPNSEPEEWLRQWLSVQAKDLIDSQIVTIGASTTVEDACDALLSNNTACIAIEVPSPSCEEFPFLGLFDFADVNAFLTLAATQHNLSPEYLSANPRVDEIVKAAKAGKVPVSLVSNLSEKNPLEILPDTSTVVDLLSVFARGTHRILIRSGPPDATTYIGYVSDRALLAYFHAHAQTSAPLARFLANALHSLSLTSLSLRSEVVCCAASAPLCEAMSLMSEQGVSSVAVIEDSPAPAALVLLSAVSVTDVGKIVLPSQNKSVLQISLRQFIAQIKEPDGSTDGVDRYPVYSVSAASSLRYTIEKILATNAHRVFVVEEPSHSPGSSFSITGGLPVVPGSFGPPTSTRGAQLRGVVSIVDVLALFARFANLPDIDPARMKRHRRASSARSLSPEVVSTR